MRRGAERDRDWAASETEALHRDRYRVAEDIYLEEVRPLPLVDVVIDNSEFDDARIIVP